MPPTIFVKPPSTPDADDIESEPSFPIAELGQHNTDPSKERQAILKVDQIWDKKRRKYVFIKSAKPKDRKKKFSQYVITVARRISTHGTYDGYCVVEIRGPSIREALSEFYKDIKSLSFPETISLTSEELKLLYYALPDIEQRLEAERNSESPNKDVIFELESATQFIKEYYGDTMTKLQELPEHRIEFDILWTMFPQRTLVHGFDELGQDQIFRVKQYRYSEDQNRNVFFQVDIEYLDSDGDKIGYVDAPSKTIPQFQGSKSIHDIPVVPLQLRPGHIKLRERLIARGERLLKLQGRHLQEYKGHAIDEGGKRFNSHGRVMLDPLTLDRINPTNSIVPVISTSLGLAKMTLEHKMLLRPVLYGFSLGDKTWGAFAVSRLSDVCWNDGMIHSLVLNENRKKFIYSLVKQHGFKANEDGFDDFVSDKGKGLVGLLAGPPGVGKTFTAEAVAEITHQPLYVISSGELGDSSSSVQNNLADALELGETWRAVVLLDEADVFLAKRDDQNLVRNAVVSVFLRLLEYYQGILLLTTNRLDSFDDAFQSRIHFCFKYKQLDTEARSNIWRSFLDRAKSISGIDCEVEEDDIATLSQEELNGRQIKNIMSMSQAVATQRKEAITMEIITLALNFPKEAE
ncbi:P-loop containing nucleoside triphosphate hydrolase protein [Jackrogersella minutella]|nr:P-loop containing nucleoside triphosphate hydrolase protein [Jackrogersella minutella]